MNQNILSLIASMETFLLSQILPVTSPMVKLTIEYFNDFKTRANLLLEGISAGELSQEFVLDRIKEEKVNLKAHVLSLIQIEEAFAQSVANNVILLFEAFIDNILKTKES